MISTQRCLQLDSWGRERTRERPDFPGKWLVVPINESRGFSTDRAGCDRAHLQAGVKHHTSATYRVRLANIFKKQVSIQSI